MAEELTAQQRAAVQNRGGRLLVSAAAGSGKTKVLVDRLMSYIMDPVDPANLDDFLIITYTKAAAAELRGKIAAKLTEHMAAQPENRHLQRQMQRLYLAKISTVHAFCADILKEYAYMLDIPADFRVADENECRELRDACMQKLLDEAYANALNDADFRAFVDTQGLGRDDRLVPEILLKVYDSARCHLNPEGWLDNCVANAQVADTEDAGKTPWGEYLMADLFYFLDLQLDGMRACAEAAAGSEGLEKPAAVLWDTVRQLEHLRSSTCWDDVVNRSGIDFGRLSFPRKDHDRELAERIKAVREACKSGLGKKLRCFTNTSTEVLADLSDSAAAVRGMVSLAKRFGAAYDRAKRVRRILDFGDMEHKTLDLLLGKHRSGPTAVAREIEKRFREIMVDEYQDSNGVQDAIFMALTQNRNNCFMVGDVKQSIYQFRLADPGIFIEKYGAYRMAEEAEAGQGRKVLLTRNFRSGGAVLSGVNDVFRACMSTRVGGLAYGEAEALVEGVTHAPLGEPEVELWAIPVAESTYEEEAALVAQRVSSLLDGTHQIRDDKKLRPIRPEDIAILLRSPGSVGGSFTAALARLGIRCTTGGGEDLLQTVEVSVLRSILQTISNPRQDIPLIAALTSPVFGFTADDLAAFRGQNRRGSVYDSLRASEDPKVLAFLDVLTLLRRAARLLTLPELIELIFTETRILGIFAAMPEGDLRRENLLAFYQLTADYASGCQRDLEQFLDHLSAMEDMGLITASGQTAAGAVTLMSIHKSKGLEFPVVIVAGLSRSFNRESTRAQVLCDQELGLGLSAVDAVNRVRYPTIAKRAIAAKIVSDSLSEEMRVLYVALTRAKDRLIMTYASKYLEKEITDLVRRMDIGHPELITADVVCPGEWVLLAALRRTEAGALFALGGKPVHTQPGEPAWLIRVESAQTEQMQATAEPEEVPQIPEETLSSLRETLEFRYAFEAATKAPSKQTATQRKGRYQDAEAAEDTSEPLPVHRSWRVPAFQPSADRAMDQGTAMHAALQYIRYEVCTGVQAVDQELNRLVDQKFLTSEQRAMVDSGKLARFFDTELGRRLRASKAVLREFKFSILDDGKNFSPELAGEQILLQGVVDCALIEPDGITVVDFKTDKVSPQTVQERAAYYRPQVLAYAEALERIYGLPVKAKLLYFFHIESFVTM